MAVALNWLWQGCIVAIACLVMLRSLDRARANVRYVVCWIALLCVLALPIVAWLQEASLPSVLAPADGGAVVPLPNAWWTSTAAMLGAWTAWAVIGAVRFLSALLDLRRARAGVRAFPTRVESSLACWNRVRVAGRPATLVLSDAVPAAAVLGGGRPIIAVAPSLLRTLDECEIDRVLVHEWVHVQRRDDLVAILQTAVRIVAGWHPAVWLLDRRLRLEREIACDEATVTMTGTPRSYAQCLMKLAELRTSSREALGAPAVLIASDLRARVTRIVSRRLAIAPARSRGIAFGNVFALCALSFGLTALPIVEATALALPLESIQLIDRAIVGVASPTPGVPAHARGGPLGGAPTDGPQGPPLRRQVRILAARPPIQQSRFEEAASYDDAAQPHVDPSKGTPALATSSDSAGTPAATERAGVDLPEPAVALEPPKASAFSIAVEQVKTPWAAVADGGTALGRKSKDAGLATAGVFTRFARQVAGSF